MQVKLKFGPSGSIFDRVIILELRKNTQQEFFCANKCNNKTAFDILASCRGIPIHLVPPSQLPNEYYFQL